MKLKTTTLVGATLLLMASNVLLATAAPYDYQIILMMATVEKVEAPVKLYAEDLYYEYNNYRPRAHGAKLPQTMLQWNPSISGLDSFEYIKGIENFRSKLDEPQTKNAHIYVIAHACIENNKELLPEVGKILKKLIATAKVSRISLVATNKDTATVPISCTYVNQLMAFLQNQKITSEISAKVDKNKEGCMNVKTISHVDGEAGAVSCKKEEYSQEELNVEENLRDGQTRAITEEKLNVHKKVLMSPTDIAKEDKTGRFNVVLEDDTSEQRFDELKKIISLKGTIYGSVYEDFIKLINAELPDNTPKEIINEEGVDFIEEEMLVTASVLPWHLDRITMRGHFVPSAKESLNSDFTGQGVDIYILDTGIRRDHDEFKDGDDDSRVQEDPDPTLDIADTHSEINHQQGGHCPPPNHPDPQRLQKLTGIVNHGTHVAALAAGNTYGVAKDARLYSVRVFECTGRSSPFSTIEGLDQARAKIRANGRPAVINLSLGGRGRDMTESRAITNIVMQDNIPVIVSAGNEKVDACDYSPAFIISAITVGATNNEDQRALFSNWGTCVDIMAPGEDIMSAITSGHAAAGVMSGTSMAAPIVTGVVAAHLGANPELTPAQIRDILTTHTSTKGVISNTINSWLNFCPNELLYFDDMYQLAPETTSCFGCC